jgi:hypothetical protein
MLSLARFLQAHAYSGTAFTPSTMSPGENIARANCECGHDLGAVRLRDELTEDDAHLELRERWSDHLIGQLAEAVADALREAGRR